MKKRPVFILFLALSLRLAAQLPTGAIAPDFTAQDINGQSWHLYDLLADDKIVVLEISATWCPPCWSYHNGHALQDLYAAHGPAGDDRLRVLFVEGDPNTEVDCLYGQPGCSYYAPGNWVQGTNFPIFDNAAIADSFQISYFPTIFIICPNRKTYEVNQLGADDLWGKAQACPVAFGANNAGLYEYSTGSDLHEICTSLDVAPSFSLINLGENPLTSASVELRWNDSLVQTLPWTGYLPVYGEVPLSFDGLPLDVPGTLTATLTTVNQVAADEDTSNNLRSNEFFVAPQFADQQILLKIKTDQYGSETYWELHDDSGAVLDHGGNPEVGPNGGGAFPGSPPLAPGAYSSNTVINEILNLPGPGCYSLHFVDAYGDGICCGYGNGYYKLYNYDNPNQLIMNGGVFEAYDHRAFGDGTPAVGTLTANAEAAQVQVFPNPATEFVTVQCSLPNEDISVSGLVVNSLGQIVSILQEQTGTAGEQQWQIDTAAWPSGIYAIRLQINGRLLLRAFVKQ